jgi:hypothetical protein
MLTEGRPDPSKKSHVNYEKLGKAVEDALILDYVYILHSTRRQIWSSFMRGAFAGLGGVIGATVGVAVLLGLLTVFGGIPVIGHWFTQIGQTIESGHPHSTPAP